MNYFYLVVICLTGFTVGMLLLMQSKSWLDFSVAITASMITLSCLIGLFMYRQKVFENCLGMETPFFLTWWAAVPIDIFGMLAFFAWMGYNLDRPKKPAPNTFAYHT